MIGNNDVARIQEATAYDSSGEKIGKVGQLYLDDQTSEPSWITVSTGFFGLSESFVPLQGAQFRGDDIRLAYDKDKVKHAPRIDRDRHLDPEQEQELFRHYGLTTTGTGRGMHATTGQTEGRDRGAFKEHAMTLSEERLAAGKERVEAGRARLRKYTTTHTEQVEVPVTKEKLVVERTPASGKATDRPIKDSGEHVEEVTLYEERPVVAKETVPVEEVRVGKERVTETEQVSGEVRKEHADLDVDEGRTKAKSAGRPEDRHGR